MRSLTVLLSVALLAGAVAVVGIVNAADGPLDEVRAKARQMQQRAEQLEKEGMEGKAAEMRQAAENLVRQAELHAVELQRAIREKERRQRGGDRRRDAEHRRDGDREREHHQRERDGDPDRRREPENHHRREMMERFETIHRATEHMREAAELLHKADIHELADHLQRKSDELTREIQRNKVQFEETNAVDKLYREVERLHQRMGEMEKRIDQLSRRRN